MLIAQAVGYPLRDTSPFRPLTIIDEPLAEGRVDAPYAHTLHVAGGIPAYYWVIDSGRLPRGLSLDSFTGAVSGTPSESGWFTFTVRDPRQHGRQSRRHAHRESGRGIVAAEVAPTGAGVAAGADIRQNSHGSDQRAEGSLPGGEWSILQGSYDDLA